MTHLYLIRHADYIYDLVDGEFPKRDQGLSEDGKTQAEKLRDRLAGGEIKPDVFISSPERGAHETAQTIAPVLGLPILLDEDVAEWRSEDGSLTTEQFMEPWNALTPDQKPYHRWVEGCETLAEFVLRVHTTLHRIVAEHEGKTILIMTHGAFIQSSFAYFFGYNPLIQQRGTPEIGRTSITQWVKMKDTYRWVLERSNDRHHLG